MGTPVLDYHQIGRDNKFPWMGARENHCAVFSDEFDIRNLNVGDWKLAVEGSPFKTNENIRLQEIYV